MVWWVALGYPSFEEGKDGFPRIGQVVKYYRENKMDDRGRAWTQTKLAGFLKVTEKAVWNIEHEEAKVDVDRRRRLSGCLEISPLLLGIRTREEILKLVEERRAEKGASVVSTALNPPQCWWTELGYPAFAPGSDGFFPRTGQVVKYYRRRKMDAKGKPWSQRRLANALSLESDQAVWDLENRDTELDMERRRFLSDLLGIPPMLFGIITRHEINKLVEQQRSAQSGVVVVSPSVSISHHLTIDVEQYTALLNSFWETFLSNPTQISMTNIDLCIEGLTHELPRVREKKPLQELLCRFHDLVACILRDQQKYDEALVRLEKASWLAEILQKDELKILVLYNYGNTLWKANCLDDALEKYEQARRYEQRLPRNLEDSLLLETGRAEAQDAETQDQKDAAIALVDQVGNHLRSRSKRIAEDPYFLDLDLDRYHLTRSFALIAVGRNKDALGELELVKASPERPRRQANKDIFQAQALTNLGEYSEAADFAASGLVVAQESNSEINIARVERMYKQFPRGLFKHDEHVARLEYLLSKRKKSKRRKR